MASKPITTLELITSVLGLLKTVGVVLAMTLIDFARAKEKHAENKLAVTKTESRVAAKRKEIENAAIKSRPDGVINDYLDSGRGRPESDDNPAQ